METGDDEHSFATDPRASAQHAPARYDPRKEGVARGRGRHREVSEAGGAVRDVDLGRVEGVCCHRCAGLAGQPNIETVARRPGGSRPPPGAKPNPLYGIRVTGPTERQRNRLPEVMTAAIVEFLRPRRESVSCRRRAAARTCWAAFCSTWGLLGHSRDRRGRARRAGAPDRSSTYGIPTTLTDSGTEQIRWPVMSRAISDLCG